MNKTIWIPVIGGLIFGSLSFLITAAMFLGAFSYRSIYQRMKMPPLLVGWVLIMIIYYLVGVTLQVTLVNIAFPGLETSYGVYFSNVRLEFVLATVITSLILLALPERYRRPQWIQQQHAPKHSGAVRSQ